MNRNARLSSASVLDRIVAAKRDEVEVLRPRAGALRRAADAAAQPPDLLCALTRETVAVVAEVKRRSPSAGDIHEGAAAQDVAATYAGAGAAAVSVLTDREWFGGALDDLTAVAAQVSVPLLRKDFTIDELQVLEARAAGAAAVLLIVRILDDAQLSGYRELAESLGMQALVEVHDAAELERAAASGARIIGVNNRDLATFETDLAVTERLAGLMPRDVVWVSESGIRTQADVVRVSRAGASAVLVGESLMRARDPSALLRELAAVPRRVQE